jgi:hypothetical protein
MISSMQYISKVSLFAIISIVVTLAYIVLGDVYLLYTKEVLFDKRLEMAVVSGIPSFFGITLFMFEGNAVALDIYY